MRERSQRAGRPSRVLKRSAVAILLISLVACARGASGDGESGIQGEVTVGPTCPVQMQNSPCPDAPFAATVIVSKDGTRVATAETGADGKFHISLEPGVYDVTAEPLEEGGIASLKPLPPVTVAEGAYTAVTIPFDSGIR